MEAPVIVTASSFSSNYHEEKPLNLRVDGKFPTDEDLARLVPIFEEKKIDLSRPIRHWTIDFIQKRADLAAHIGA